MIIFDFDGVFTTNEVYIDQNGIESVVCSRSDGLGLARLRELNMKVCIVSTEENPVVSVRARKLKLECHQGVANKSIAVRKLCSEYNVPFSDVMFVGNDINDIPVLKVVGVPVGVSDSFEEIFPYIKFITKNSGGRGAVREICDIIFSLRQQTS
jgi:YrbI family 3-deoxy-D-manno-octulosonate 8-phosphate phosphatase